MRSRQHSFGPSLKAGFSLLELLVAMAISLTALSLAAGLLLESQSRIAHVARRALDPVGEIVSQQLRADLRAAIGARGGSSAFWSREPLVLDGHPVGVLGYEKQDDVLYRFTPAGRRPLVHSVTTFRWRRRGGSVEVDLRYRVAGRWNAPASDGVRGTAVPVEERVLLLVTPRGGGGRQW